MNICQNPECDKALPEGKTYCGEPCIKRHLEIKKAEKENSDLSLSDKLHDPAFQRGVTWRMRKLQAIHDARNEGKSNDWILRELMVGGLTRQTAERIMDDSKFLFGKGQTKK
jgi:hypothetical protein